MVCVALQVAGLILGTISWFGMIATCASAEWRRNRSGNAILDMSVRYEGLWQQCRDYVNGESKCKPYDKLFVGVPAVLQVCRALMIASLVLGLFANIITILGMRCTSVGNRNPQAKARAAIVGGILFLVSGLHVGMAVSVYAWCTSAQCFDHLQVTGLRSDYEMGPAVIGGWIIMTSSFWSAFLTIVNYNSLSKPTKTMDLTQIRADSLTGQFSDIVSEGAKGVYKSKSPVDSGYTSTGLDSNWGLYSTVSYPSSVASSPRNFRAKLIKPERRPNQRHAKSNYNATSNRNATSHPFFESSNRDFVDSNTYRNRHTREPNYDRRNTRARYSPTSDISFSSSNREYPLRRYNPRTVRPRSHSPTPSHSIDRSSKDKKVPLTRNYHRAPKRKKKSSFYRYPEFGSVRQSMVNPRSFSRGELPFDRPGRSPFYPAPQFSSLRQNHLDLASSPVYQREPQRRNQFPTNFHPRVLHNAYGEPMRRSFISTSYF